MRLRGFGTAAVLIAATFGMTEQARADVDTFFVDTTSDASRHRLHRAAADCSLRGAFANADDGDISDTDSIIFDAQVFDGEAVPMRRR